MYMDKRGRVRVTNGPRRTRMGQEFCCQTSTNDRTTHPDSYSPFFHWKASDRTVKDPCAYDDRMRQWKYDKWNEVCNALPPVQNGMRRFEYQSQETLSKMLSDYYGETLVCTALVEGCNVSNGYPYYVFYWRKVLASKD